MTLEPCFHFGRTPPCVDAVIRAGIRKVVIGMRDPNPRTNGRSIAGLRRAGIKVRTGILKHELQILNESFIKYIRYGMPFVVTKTAQTLDGKIATAAGESQWITSPAARAFARRQRDRFDAILVGINTVRQDDPALNAARPSKRLKKIVLDPGLSINPRARLFRGVPPENCILAVTRKAPLATVDTFRRRGVRVVVCPSRKEGVCLQGLMRELAKLEIASVLIEGGSRVVGSALRQGVADKMHVYIAPRIIGDGDALSSVTGLKTLRLRQAVTLRHVAVQRIGPDLFVEGDIRRSSRG